MKGPVLTGALNFVFRKYGVVSPIVGHVGDGNFHMMLLVDPNNQDEMNRAKKVVENMIDRAVRMGGTCTGNDTVEVFCGIVHSI